MTIIGGAPTALPKSGTGIPADTSLGFLTIAGVFAVIGLGIAFLFRRGRREVEQDQITGI
jgi:hypothetical protein